jgi:Thiamine pyrophosphate-requiring enzymes [acetolactate synthase, pyruvate dehydrogenase (cytochrome), glyoxylate carboligase, phosphonopyruvate decarboxylase]
MPKGSDVIAGFLNDQGVDCVFELVGGMIVHLLDSIHQAGQIRIVSMHHEQGAAFAAEGYARITGVPGVAMATSGPGATNLLTGIASCYFDSTPAVFITGQVNRNEMKGDRAIRQMGFQETDIVSLAAPITKAAWQVETPEQLPVMLQRSFQLAKSGRPGPVLLDVPMDIQRADVPIVDDTRTVEPAVEPSAVEPSAVDALINALRRAERPLVLVGGGVRAAQATDEIRELLNVMGVPVVNSLMGVDVLPATSDLRVGMIGSYGNRWANLAVGRSDFLLVLGSRLDIRQTGSETDAFKEGRGIFQVDCDPGEMNNRVTGVTAILADLKRFATAALPAARAANMPDRSGWMDEIRELRARWPDTEETGEPSGINPNVLMHQLSVVSGSAAVYVADVGQHQMWAAQSLDLLPGQRFLTSGGLGSMGFGLPAAIGASFASPGRPVVLVAGDGGFQTNIQELQTVARNRLPVKMLIVNNRTHGMVRQFQQSYFDSRFQSTVWGYSAPDFAAVASAYGIPSSAVETPERVEAGVSWLLAEPGPALLEVMVSPETNAYPKLAFGRPITEMEPFASPVGMEGT